MLKNLVLTLILTLLNKFPEQVEVHISCKGESSFEEWLLKLDNNQVYDFDTAGKLALLVPEGCISFEILDETRHTRFLGTWEQYPSGKPVIIEIHGEGMTVHQVVSASRIQQSSWEVAAQIEVLRIEDQPERALAQTSDLLKEDAGVMLQKTNLGGGSPILRGMSGNRILLMVDGFRLNNATFRLGLNQYLNTVPAAQLEQIEVLSGPSGVQYGSDGLGGTIHLRSRDPASMGHEPGLNYHGFASTADGTNTHQLNGHAGKGKLFASGHLNYNNYENLEAADPVGEQDDTGFDSWDGSLNLTYKLDGDRRLRMLNSHSKATEVPRTDRIQSGRDLVWQYDPQILSFQGLRYESVLRNRALDYMELGLGRLFADEGNRRISANSPERLSLVRTKVTTLQLNGTFTKVAEHIHWVYGFDSQGDSLASNGLETDLPSGASTRIDGKFPDDSEYTSYGLFVVPKIKVGKRSDIRLGLRQSWVSLRGTLASPIDTVDETFRQLTPSLTWSYVGDHNFLSLGAGQGFRAPNLEDTLSLGPSNNGFDAPNPNLQPEKLWSYEVNYRFRSENALFQANLYTSRYHRLIERVPGAWMGQSTVDGEPVFILDNVGSARIDGMTLTYRRRLNKRHHLNADAAWTHGTQTERQVPMGRIPPLRGNLNWTYENRRLRLASLLGWAQRQDRLSPGDMADSRIPEGGTPGYTVLHLRGRYTYSDRFAINMAAENLTDKLYKSHGSGIYEPGRRIVLELDFKLR